MTLLLVVFLAACAVPPLRLPDGPGAPVPDVAPLFETAVAQCTQTERFEALIRLRGRGGGARLNGQVRVRAGLSAPGSARLEGVGPFGAQVFLLVARPGEAVLWLMRDKRVLRDVSAAEMLQSLVGVSLSPADLRAVLTGCLVDSPRPMKARAIGDWVVVDLAGGAVAYLQRVDGDYRLTAGRRGPLTIYYDQFQLGLPREVRVTSESETAPGAESATDLTASLSQVNTNLPLPESAFVIDVPPDVLPMTVRDLRRAGPLDAPPDAPDER